LGIVDLGIVVILRMNLKIYVMKIIEQWITGSGQHIVKLEDGSYWTGCMEEYRDNYRFVKIDKDFALLKINGH